MTEQNKNTHEHDVQDQNVSEQETQEFAPTEEVALEAPEVEEVNVVDIEEAKTSCADFLRKHLKKEYEVEEAEVAEETEWKARLDEAIGNLYAGYKANGEVPTLGALVVALRSSSDECSHHMANVLETMKHDPFLPKPSKKKLIAIIIGVVVAMALIAAGVAFAINSQQPKPQEEPAHTSVTKVEVVESEGISVNVTCEGWNAETSTPIALAIYEGDVKDTLLSTDENVEVPTPINEISLKAGEDIKLEDIVDAGTYTLSIVGSPVLEDGTIFDVPDPQVVEFDGKTGQVVKFELNKKDATEVTEADIAAATAAATAVGADTNKLTNATNNTRTQATNVQGGTIQKGQGNAQSKPSKPSSGNNSGNSGGNSGGSTQPSQPSQPSHTHNWVAVTKTVNHPAEYKTVHHDAVVEEVVMCECGLQNPGRDHVVSNKHTTSVKTITVQPAYDEQVLVKEAWTETVTTGYKCSSCGATK